MPVIELLALLANCKLNPLDDGLREALAAWLLANNQPERGEFVRLQLATANVEDDWTPQRTAIASRVAWLFKQHVEEWTGGQRRLDNPYWFLIGDGDELDEDEDAKSPQGKLERGLIRVSSSPAQLQAVMQQIPTHALPWLETLELHGLTKDSAFDLDGVCAFTAVSLTWEDECPPLVLDLLDRADLRELSLMSDEGCGPVLQRLASAKAMRPHKLYVDLESASPKGWKALIGSAVVSELRHLELGAADQDGVLDQMARSNQLGCLGFLSLSGDNFSSESLRALFDSHAVSKLTDLQICGYSGNIAGVASSLAAARSIRGLRNLDLAFNTIDTAGAAALARSPVVETLRSLSFSSGELTNQGLRELAATPKLNNLVSLDLACTGVGDVGVIALARSPHFANLRHLSICRCAVTVRGLKALASSPHLAGLEALDISLNTFGPDDLLELAASAHLGSLRQLGIRDLRVSGKAFSSLLRSPIARHLEELDLQSMGLDREHIAVLANLPSSVRKLTFGQTAMRPGSIDAIFNAPWMADLVELSLPGCGLGDSGAQKLARLKACRLVRLDLSNNALTNKGAEALLAWPGLRSLAELSLHGNSIDPALERQIMEIAARPTK